MLYVCLGYNLGLIDVDGSIPIDFIGSGGCPWLHVFNVCREESRACCGLSKCTKIL